MKAGNGGWGTGNGSSLAVLQRDSHVGSFDSTSAVHRVDAATPSCSPHAKHSQQGFSLLEVIAAILLLAITFAALMQVAGSSIGLTNNAADHAQAALWARSMLDIAGVDQPLQPGSSEGRFNTQYRWRLKVAPWNPGNASPDVPLRIYKLDLDVLWGPQIHERSAHFSTLRLVGANGNGRPPLVPR